MTPAPPHDAPSEPSANLVRNIPALSLHSLPIASRSLSPAISTKLRTSREVRKGPDALLLGDVNQWATMVGDFFTATTPHGIDALEQQRQAPGVWVMYR
jgi:hypothetical protein